MFKVETSNAMLTFLVVRMLDSYMTYGTLVTRSAYYYWLDFKLSCSALTTTEHDFCESFMKKKYSLTLYITFALCLQWSNM
jgi:hypothetical protein